MAEHHETLTPLPPDERWAAVADRMGLLDRGPLWGDSPTGHHWLPGAALNLSVTCLDRHLAEHGDRVAVHWEGEPGDRESLTYTDLHERVTAMARTLTSLGVAPGDRVGVHLGWLPETVVVILACARIGAVHSVLPSSLPAGPLADRLQLLDPKILFTQDGAWRHGTVLPLKARADDALAAAGSVEHTIVVRRTGMDVAWYEGDRWYHDLVATPRQGAPEQEEPPALDADHPLAVYPMANRGGHQVSVLHGTAAVLANAIAVHGRLRTGGPFWCAGDIAWPVTQFHGVYGPLAWGDTAVMYEGTLDVPDHSRAWDIVRRYEVETLLTNPSVMRTVRGWARELVDHPRITSLRRVATAGEPVEPQLRAWMTEHLGGGELDILDGWGQLELAGIVQITGADDPETALPDCGLDLVDRRGRPVADGEVGEVVLRRPWAGAVSRPRQTDHWGHWERHPGLYATGDMALRSADGSIQFQGRADEVVSVSGHLVSLREVREVLVDHPFVSSARVTVRQDRELGRALVAAVTLTPTAGRDPDLDAVAVELMESVREALGGLARPRAILVVDRFGDELDATGLSRAIATLAAPHLAGAPRTITWEQLVAASGE